MMETVHKDFEEFKKDNKELNLVNLSFEAPEPNQTSPQLPNTLSAGIMDKNSMEEKKLIPEISQSPSEAPFSEHEESEPETVVDRQMTMLMSRLVGLLNDKRYFCHSTY